MSQMWQYKSFRDIAQIRFEGKGSLWQGKRSNQDHSIM